MTRTELERLESEAAAGDAQAQLEADRARHDDENVSLGNFERALRWLRMASAQGLGIAVLHDLESKMNRERLVPVIVSDSSADDAPPFPFRPSRDRLLPGVAANALQKLARIGNDAAIHDLGLLCCFDGDPRFARPPVGNGRAIAAAYRHFSDAAERGISESCFALGCLSLVETGFKSLRLAVRALEAAAGLGHVAALRALEWIDTHQRLRVTVMTR